MMTEPEIILLSNFDFCSGRFMDSLLVPAKGVQGPCKVRVLGLFHVDVQLSNSYGKKTPQALFKFCALQP